VPASQPAVAVRDATNEYRKLVTALASRALKRSLANPASRAAIDYYFHDHPPAGLGAPDWPLGQLFAWLHGVLRFVVREESGRVSSRREVLPLDAHALDVRDPSPDQLDLLIDDEQRMIVRECLSTLGEDYRRVLTMRAEGVKYTEIALRLGVSENTVATWVRRGMSTVAQQVRERMDLRPRAGTIAEHRK
jgi:RNA polymerase sigma factor (sigma-70 family)